MADTNFRRLQYCRKRLIETHGYLVGHYSEIKDDKDVDYAVKYNMPLRGMFQLNNGRTD